MRSILVIDDNETLLQDLVAELQRVLAGTEVEIRSWVPTRSDSDPKAAFDQYVDNDTTLVITDQDLTSQGKTGLFGSSIVAWCQSRGIPVADFSRGNVGGLSKEPDLFELRIPTEAGLTEIGTFIAGVFDGFKRINDTLKARPELLEKRSPASVLAEILETPDLESQYALYAVRFGTASGALMDRVASAGEPNDEQKIALLVYIAGHLLLNAILRFPGPIVSARGLKAYLASDEADTGDVIQLFTSASYAGPFGNLDRFYWLTKIDAILDGLTKALPADLETETSGELYRRAIEKKLGRDVNRHSCPRCAGLNGGFYCPITKKTVCQRSDCSVGANSWIPQGATLCRIERVFFDEWAPILGL